MDSSYEPKKFWEHRLSKNFSLRAVGHIRFSETYNTWLYRRKKHCIEKCFRRSDLKGKKVLDVGCGTGFFIDWYLQHGAQVCGIDITRICIEKLKQKHSCEFHTQDITDPGYDLYDKEFDIVNMWDVAYHITDYKRFYQAFFNIAKSIKDDGILVLTDWFGAASDRCLADHVVGRCLDTYQQYLSHMGFQLVEIHSLYHHLNRMHIGRIDNYLGWFYYLLDNCSKKIAPDNLSLSIWRYTPDTTASGHVH